MKKIFKNFTKRKQERYEEFIEEYPENDYAEDGYYENGYPEDNDEYYGEEEYPDEDGEYYGEEEYPDEDGEYYEEEEYPEGDGGYYEEEEYPDEDGGYYEEEEYPEGDGGYYEEAEYPEGDGEYYEEEEYPDENGEYYGEEEYSDDDVYYMDDSDADDWEKSSRSSVFSFLMNKFKSMDLTDRIVACTGVIVLALALVTGIVFAGTRVGKKQLNEFASLGSQLEGIEVIGGKGLTAVADARIAREEAAKLLEEEKNQHTYEEEELSKSITVALKMNSIKKDLKIKIVNKKTGKLISNIPFEAAVTGPDGVEEIWTDSDKDGIIYKTELASGKYTVILKELEDYKKLILSTIPKEIEVKENLDYEKVDVTDEIKDESEVDVSKEDTAQNNVEEESRLEDTVKWVESTQTPTGEVYVEVPKSSIEDPQTKIARFGGFRKMSAVNVPEIMLTVSSDKPEIVSDGTANLTAVLKDAPDNSSVTYVWTLDDNTSAKLEGNGTSAVLTGMNQETSGKTVTVTVQATVTTTCTVTGGDETENTEVKEAACSVVIGVAEISLSTTTLNIRTGEKATLTAEQGKNAAFTWKSSNEKVAAVDEKGNVTAVSKGDAVITVTGAGNKSATCTVKVQLNAKTDTSTALKDKKGNQLYVLDSRGQYVAAVSADYYKSNQKFFIKQQQGYKYTGWQTLDGKVYFFDENGSKVTGAQVIQGAQYSFDGNGVLVSSNGILGIDVSKWNKSIDWNAVKNSGVSYVIIRCGYRGSTEGKLIEDPRYRENIKGASTAGLKVGVYFFTQAVNEIEAVEEASMVLSLVNGYKLSYPIFLDVESSGGRADGISRETRTAVCKAFCKTIKNSGYSAGIYANKTWFTNYIDAGQLSAYRIWLAQYASQPTYTGRYDIWQYSSRGTISGIQGNVDMNLSYMGY